MTRHAHRRFPMTLAFAILRVMAAMLGVAFAPHAFAQTISQDFFDFLGAFFVGC